MDLQQKLKEQGWYITNEGLEKLPADIDKCDSRKVVQSLLNIDLRDVGAGALPAEVSRKDDSIMGRIVLQVVKVRNISAPKSNEESKTAPRFLYLELTDGANQIFALELEHISSISLNTPPGTKLYLRSEKIPLMQGTLVLRPSDVQVLGGEVTALVEKWELTRTLQKYARGGRVHTGTSGPPPWIPFGQKIQQFNDDKNFKSLAAGNGPEKEKDGKENEFDAMRNEAIAEAAKSGAKKVFGGGNQQMLDHNVKKIIEKGFSEMDAKNALKTTRNNLERALYNLKRRDEGRERSESKDVARVPNKRGAFKEAKKGGGKEDPIAVPTKPAGNVSLFDFLTDKLPASTEASATTTTTTTTSTTMSSNNKYEKPAGRYDSSKTYGSSTNQSQHQYNSGHHSQGSIPNNQQTSSASTNSREGQQSNRSTKFENNISSSFANRNTTSGVPESGDFGNNYRNRQRNERGERSTRGGYSAPYSSRHSGDAGRSGGGGGSSNSNHGYSNSNRTNQPTRVSQDRDRDSNHQQSDVHAQDNQTNEHKGGSDYKSYRNERPSSTRYPNKSNYSSNSTQNNTNNSRNHSDNRNSNHSESEKMKELIDVTAKMKIENKPSSRGGMSSGRGQRSHSHYQQQNHHKEAQQHQQSNNAPQQQQQQHIQVGSQSQIQHAQKQQQQPHALYTQLPNGFAYDPNKIRGFQNKESNEYALSLLKTQTIPPTGATLPPPPPQTAHPTYPQPPPPMQIPPQQTFHAAPPPFIMQPPHIRAFGIPTMDGILFNWATGDRCLAKYWDDGRFYEAEITGMSDKTCVVLFLGYGNYEEVLKSDCLPINNNHTIIAHQPTPVVPQTLQQAVHPVLPQSNARTVAIGATTSGRYRGERQMYVPPPKREV